MISLACPWLLLLLPLPLVIRFILPNAKNSHRLALKVPFYNEIVQISKSYKPNYRFFNWRHVFAYTIWFLLVLACAGPQWLGAPLEMPRNGRNIMLAVDISNSMMLPDFNLGNRNATRLDVVKIVASEFIMRRKGDRVGLIVFGSKAYLRTPLTYDLETVKNALDDTTIGLAGQFTAIGDAIGLAIKRLRHYPENNRVLIVLTDGASNSGTIEPLQAAKLAAAEHIRIYPIGIGADRLIVAGLFDNQVINPSIDLDETTLKKIASLTQGTFHRAKDTQTLANIYQTIDKLEPINNEDLFYRPFKPLYQWPLALALLLSIILMLRKIMSSKHAMRHPEESINPITNN